MKKIFFIILSCVVLISTLIIPSFASFPSSYLDNSNLLDEYNTINAIYPSEGLQPLYYVELERDTTYTFVAPSGVDRFLCSPIVEDYPGSYQPYVFSYDSVNLYNQGNFSGSFSNGAYKSVMIYRIYENGTYYLDYDYSSSSNIVTDLVIWQGSSARYYTLDSNTGTHGSKVFNIDFVPEGSYVQLNVTLTNLSGSTVDYSFSNIWFSTVPREANYTPGWAPTSYSDGYVQTYTFNTGINGGGTYAIGFKDSMLENDGFVENQFFSRDQAEDSKFYLVKGDLDLDSFYEYYYNNGYNSGYGDGYKIGENDGLSSSSMLRSIIFTILSAPFVIVSNVLDFELLGINIYNLVKVSITILLIAWVITRLKGRE